MPYSQFTTIGKVKEAFNLAVAAGIRFLPEIEPIAPATALQTLREINLPWAIAASRALDISHLRQHFQMFSPSPLSQSQISNLKSIGFPASPTAHSHKQHPYEQESPQALLNNAGE